MAKVICLSFILLEKLIIPKSKLLCLLNFKILFLEKLAVIADLGNVVSIFC